jgi:hypothetical protein
MMMMRLLLLLLAQVFGTGTLAALTSKAAYAKFAAGLYEFNSVDPYSLKAPGPPGFNP